MYSKSNCVSPNQIPSQSSRYPPFLDTGLYRSMSGPSVGPRLNPASSPFFHPRLAVPPFCPHPALPQPNQGPNERTVMNPPLPPISRLLCKPDLLPNWDDKDSVLPLNSHKPDYFAAREVNKRTMRDRSSTRPVTKISWRRKMSPEIDNKVNSPDSMLVFEAKHESFQCGPQPGINRKTADTTGQDEAELDSLMQDERPPGFQEIHDLLTVGPQPGSKRKAVDISEAATGAVNCETEAIGPNNSPSVRPHVMPSPLSTPPSAASLYDSTTVDVSPSVSSTTSPSVNAVEQQQAPRLAKRRRLHAMAAQAGLAAGCAVLGGATIFGLLVSAAPAL
jgi:hypothetical protein